jgi:NAD(P)H-quinone oxidoreductase subunit 5
MTLPLSLSTLPVLIPALHLLAAAVSASRHRWQLAFWLNSAALGAAMTSCIAFFVFGADTVATTGWISSAPASFLLAVLISFVGLLVANFSRNYLAGEAREARYATMLHITLAAVSVVVLTDNLLVLLGGWVAISLTLNELLLFYPDRPRAALAAHKKYLFARIAELAVFGAALLLFLEHGSWNISTIIAAYPVESLSLNQQAAALLIALAALIKCAQLPMHGWLIQVVEAPTPVSALLHAGIINLGGYLLIAFGPLLSAAAPAQWLLLIVAGLTTVVAALVMATRVTVKVKLAWSTAAQMGLMLVECALGLYELALLHLLAHACYKAWFFLTAGATVERYLIREVAPASQTSPGHWLLALAIALPVTMLAATLLAPAGPLSPWLLVAALLTVLLAERSSVSHKAPFLAAAALGTVLLTAILGQKALVAGGLATASTFAPSSWLSLADLWVAALIGLLCLGFALLKRAPDSALARQVSAWLYAGLYLDEWATRTTLRLWPLRLPARLNPKQLSPITQEGESS